MDLPVYFISDTHLMLTTSVQEEKRIQRLFRLLNHIAENGGTLVIVGDLFDFYFEYPHVIPKMYFRVYNELYYLKRKGIEIHYILGNHDYWIQDFVTGNIATQTYSADMTFELAGKKFHLTHGDGILSWDLGYRLLKAVIRNRLFTWLFRWLHPTIGYNLAGWVSSHGHRNEHSAEFNRRVRTELTKYSQNHIANGYDFVITGHYHQAIEIPIDSGKLVILGDWINHSTYGYFDGQDVTIKHWENDA